MSSPRALRIVVLAAFSLFACERKVTGPAPSLSAAAPQAVCGEQLLTPVVLSGSGLAPLVSDSLTGAPRVNLPVISLVPSKDLAGGGWAGEALVIPDDQADPLKSRVRWTSAESMTFQMYPELSAAPGLYSVRVDNKNGQSAEFPDSLLVVPRPTLTAVVADIVCSDRANSVVLEGDFFIKAGSELPRVAFDAVVFTPRSIDECRALPGTSGLAACKKLTIDLPAQSLTAGQHALVVTNPPTVACASTEAVVLTLVPEPVVTQVRPDLVCTAEGDNALTVTGTGFISIDGSTPTLRLGSVELTTTASACTKVDGPSEDVQSCTTLSATLPRNAGSVGAHDLTVSNPAPADCSSRQPIRFTIVPPPSVTAVVSDLVCTEENDRVVTVSGSGFLTVDGATPTVRLGTLSLTSTASDCTPVDGPTETVTSCTTLSVTVPRSTPVGVLPVVVTNPPTAACSSVEAVNFFVTPPPTISSVVPEIACTAQGSTTLVISGTDFLTIDGALPVVTVGTLTPQPTVGGCVPFPAPSPTETVELCTSLTVTIPQGTATGALAISVTNPQPAGCTSTQTFSLTIVPPPTLASVAPQLFCTSEGTNDVVVTGTGFLQVDALTPRLLIGSSTFSTVLTNCTPVSGPSNTVVQSCTTATAVVGQATVAEGLHALKLINPEPAACESTEAVSVAVLPPPSITALVPDLACVAQASRDVTVEGSNFVRLGTTLPRVTIAGTALTPSSAAGCAPIAGATGAEACSSLTVAVPLGAATGEVAVTVTNPPPGGCTSAAARLFLAPPPTLSTIAPPGICANASGPVTVQLDGQDFLRVAGSQTPTVAIATRTYSTTVVASSCSALPGYSQAVEQCTSLRMIVNPGDLAGGTHNAVVTNPAPMACASTQTVPFNVVPLPTLTGSTPNTLCQQGGTIDLTGTNFVQGMVVRLLTSPSPVEASTVVVNGPTSARVTFGPLPVGGPFALEIETAGGGCSATLPSAVSVVSGPVAFFVDPPVIYNALTTQATVYASGFTANGLTVGIRLNGSSTITTVPSSFNPLKANRINFTLAAGTAVGEYDVIIRDALTTSCPGELLRAFRVVDQTTLALTAINPPFGYAGGETAVEITANPTTGGGLKALPRIYLSPTGGGSALLLGAVTIVDAGRATAVVPAGAQPGTYDLIVVNPDGGVGVLTAAFRVVADPLLVIDSVSPGSLVTGQTAAAFQVTGADFRSPTLQFRCQDATTGVITTYAAIVTGSTATSIDATVNTSTVSNGQACILRATNPDSTFADYSAVVFKNPAQKLTTFRSGPALSVIRRAPTAEAGFVTRAAQFLYAIGGDDGSGGAGAWDTVDSVPLDLFGNPGTYSVQRNRLQEPRTLAAGQRVGRFLYVAGGRSSATTVLATIDRAYLLNPADRVEVTDFDLNLAEAGLGGGVYYYRVAAVMGASDPFNPGGENLPSDPVPLSLPSSSDTSLTVTIRWAAVSGATSYLVYRTVAANDPAGSERLLATVPSSSLSYTDDGTVTPAGQAPQPLGSTGRWTTAATMATAREGAAAAVAVDPANSARVYLYVLGGRGSTGTLLNTYEALPLTVNADGSQTVGTVATGTNTLGAARWQLAAFSANAVNAPRVGTSQYIYAVGGRAAMVSGRTEAALVGPNGVLGPFANLSALTPARAGMGHALANNFLFGFGGLNGAPDNSCSSAEIGSSAPAIVNWQNTSAPMVLDRFLMGSTLHGAFIYIVGGENTATTSTRSTEQIIW